MKIAFIFLVAFLAIGSTARSQTAATSPINTVSFCRLTKTPRQFHNQIIRVKAILVMNHTPRVDGGDPFLYDVACADNDPYVAVEFSPNFKWNAAYTKLLRTQKHPDKFGNTRTLVTLVGQFQSSGQREYGHLDWADSQVVIYRIETVTRVVPRTIWPKGFKHSVRAQQIVGPERRERVLHHHWPGDA
jgi:hypothetical protein